MRLRRYVMLALLPLAACASTPAAHTPASSAASLPAGTVEQAVATITAADVQRRIAFLASDELQGRDTPSPGLEQAAAYIAEQFRSFGLQPAGDSGTYIQRFAFDASRLDLTAVKLQARAHGTVTSVAHGREFFLVPAAVDSVVGEPIYGGRAHAGMTPPTDIAGRIVVFFVPDTMGPQWQQSVTMTLQGAMGGRPGAIVLVLDSAFSQNTIGVLADQLGSQQAPLPIIGLRYDVASSIFRHAGLDLRVLAARTDAPATPLTGVTIAISTPINQSSVRVPNVVAVLPGSDPALRDEYIVFSAHMDHVGIGAPNAQGDSIYNGADDDASGTTAVIEIAEAFAALARRPARSLVFLLVSGEEKGLLGSAHFVAHPTVPAAGLVANINIDMIGRNAPDTVVAIGQDYSSLGASVQAITRAHAELGLVVAPDLWPQEQLFFRSDHFSFAAKEIPAIFFTTGLHADYHQPSDEPATIDNDKVMRIARLLFRYAHDLANTPARPTWTAAGLAEVRRATGGR